MSTRRPTLHDVAREAGINTSVVSRVINNDPRARVSDETRARIRRVASELGYQKNMLARGLRLQRTWTIGAALPALTNQLWMPFVEGVQERAQASGYVIVVSGSSTSMSVEASLARIVREGRVDGLLLTTGGELDEATIRSLAEEGRPIVMVNTRLEGVTSSVIVDDTAAARLATEHLLALGHGRIAHVAGPSDTDNAYRRLAGFSAALGVAKIDAVAVVEAGGRDAEAGCEATGRLLDRYDVTGVVMSNTWMAIGALAAARAKGRSVPDDLSVIGIHDHPLAEFSSPALTTVALPMKEMGTRAFDLLLARIEDGGQEQPSSVLIATAPRLVLRASTAPPPDGKASE